MENKKFNLKGVRIGKLLWATTDLNLDDGGEGIAHNDGHFYYTHKAAKRLAKMLGNGWRLPTFSEFIRSIYATNEKDCEEGSPYIYDTYKFRRKLKMKMGSGYSTIDYVDTNLSHRVPVRVFIVGKKDPDPHHRVNVYWTGDRPLSPNGIPNAPAGIGVWFDDDILGKMTYKRNYTKNNFYSIRLVKDI